MHKSERAKAAGKVNARGFDEGTKIVNIKNSMIDLSLEFGKIAGSFANRPLEKTNVFSLFH